MEGIPLHTAEENRDILYLLNAVRMMSHKLWAVGKILQYCLWCDKYSHLKSVLEERAKCGLGIIAVCGPLELVGHQTRATICVLGRSGMCKNGSYVNALIKVWALNKKTLQNQLSHAWGFPPHLCQSIFNWLVYLWLTKSHILFIPLFLVLVCFFKMDERQDTFLWGSNLFDGVFCYSVK